MTRTRSIIARVLAVAGAVLIAFPLVAPVGLALISLAAGAGFRLDFLMPGELFFLIAAGGVLAFVASVIARRLSVLIGVLTGASAVLLAATVWVAAGVGMASGATAAADWPSVLVMSMYALFVGATVALLVVTLVLVRGLFRRSVGATV